MLHTRISEELADDIRRIAEDLRVPVSNIVRNVLEETFSVVESVTDDVGDLFEEVVEEAEAARERIVERRRRRRPAPNAATRTREEPGPRTEPAEAASRDPAADVLGWQPLVLHRAQRCLLCGVSLERGVQGFVALTPTGLGGKFACQGCVNE